MVEYSTNYMGPIDLQWFEDRNTTEHWYGGRIDIYGLDDAEYYNSGGEYSLPIMDEQSWHMFTEWLENYKTSELVTYEAIIEDFEEDTGHAIRWADDVFGDMK